MIKSYPNDVRESLLPRYFYLPPTTLCIYVVNRTVEITKLLGRDFSLKFFSKNCHATMAGHRKFLQP